MSNRMQLIFRWGIAICLAVFLASTLRLLLEVDSPQGLVKVRNSMLFRVGAPGIHDWRPGQVPEDYKLERRAVPQFFQSVVADLKLTAPKPDDSWATALKIARHLADRKDSSPNPIKKDSITAYHQIVDNGQGYCADYTQVFNALALAAGLSVREWGMSFDGYNGTGHAFNEIFDPDRGKWIMLDSFFSFYVTDDREIPLSAHEFFTVVKGSTAQAVRIIPISSEAFAFRPATKAIDYYRRGQDSLFMIWGNNVFTYDDTPAIRFAGGWSRSLEQLVAIAAGVQPPIMIATGDENRDALQELKWLRLAILSLIVSGIVGCAAIVLYIRVRRAKSTPNY